VNEDALSGVLALVVPPAVGALVTLAVGGLAARLRRPRDPDAPPRPGRVRRWVAAVSASFAGLPPPKRRPTPWKATLAGTLGVGFGVAAYFRTRADALIGLLLTTPAFVGVAFLPDMSTGDEPTPDSPVWVDALLFSSMILNGLYANLRAGSANRRLDEALPSRLPRKTWDERRDVLHRELRLLRNAGWVPESVGDLQATVSRVRRPNHLLHLALTLATFFLWAVVWLVLTLQARNRPVREYRLVSVDEFGDWSLEPLPPAASVL
jgi:hypothetical protein